MSFFNPSFNPAKLKRLKEIGGEVAFFSQKIGIGTDNPSSKLHTLNSFNSVTNIVGYGEASDNIYQFWTASGIVNNDGCVKGYGVKISTTSDASDDARFHIGYNTKYDSTGLAAPSYLTEVLTIDREFIGLGTIAPQRKVEIFANAAPQLRLSQNHNTVFMDFQVDATGRLHLVSTDDKTNIRLGTGVELTGRSDLTGYQEADLLTNCWHNGTNYVIRRDGEQAARYWSINGNHYWHTAVQGNAGDTITWKRTLSADCNGLVSIGFDVNGTGENCLGISTTTEPTGVTGGCLVYFDGTNLKVKKPGGAVVTLG
jgi:hypothetical protein